MKQRRMKYGFCMSILMAVLLLISPLSSSAATIAKTSPPPQEISTFAAYSGHTYLMNGTESISTKNAIITMSATTGASKTVAEIGGIYQLQKWTGSQWIDSGSSLTLSKTNTSYFSDSPTRTGEPGYYYRTKIVHYVKQSGVTEQETAYSDSILCS